MGNSDGRILEGKVAIVTGAGRGVGRGHAIELARQGAKVVVNDLGVGWDGQGTDDTPAGQVVQEITDAGGEAVANYGSVTEAADCEAMVKAALDNFGSLDIVVNNAGILRDRMIFNMEPSDWDSVLAVHGRGHFLLTHFACVHWRNESKASGKPVYGRLIHTSSESGLYGNAGQSNYAFAKLGTVAFSTAVAREMEKYGVTSNAIAPRARTRMTEMTFGEIAVPESGFDKWHADNIAPFVAFLASPLAADISAQAFVVHGDEVHLVQQPVVVSTITKGDRWEPAEFGEQMNKLFGDRPSGVVKRRPASERIGAK